MKEGLALKNISLRGRSRTPRTGKVALREAVLVRSASGLGVRLCEVESSLTGSGGSFGYWGAKRRGGGLHDSR